MTVMTTWTSLRRPLAKVGRSGRSIRRQVRIASSEGRPSRRKNEPGMRPAAYIRSSTSTVSGKKSNCSLGWRPAVVADSSMVSPWVTTTEPAACLARRPVSKVTERLPKLPLSMTAVAVVTPSSASNSAVMVGADTCPSLFFVASASCGPATPLAARLRGAEPSCVRGDRCSIEALGRCRSPSRGTDASRGPLPRTGPSQDASGGGPVLPVRRVPPEGGEPSGCPGTAPSSCLAAQTQPLDERAVAGDVRLRQVVEQPAATADQQEQAPPAVVVVLVLLEVLGEVADPLGQHGDLDLGRTGVVLDRGVLGHDLLLDCALERHRSPPGRVRCGPRSESRGQVSHSRVTPAIPQATSVAPAGRCRTDQGETAGAQDAPGIPRMRRGF